MQKVPFSIYKKLPASAKKAVQRAVKGAKRPKTRKRSRRF